MWSPRRPPWHVGLSDQALSLVGTDAWTGRPRELRSAVPAGATHGPAWQPALEQLAVWLQRVPRRAALQVTLSDRLTRWQLLPWPAGVRRPRELEAFARSHFEQVYGRVAEGWTIRLGAHLAGTPVTACALDTELLEALRKLGTDTGMRLHSVQPYFARVIAHWRRSLRGRRVWLAVVERGHVCLGLAQDGHWIALDAQRSGPGWPATLAGLRTRLAAFEARDSGDDRLYMAASVPVDAALADAPWRQLPAPALAAGSALDGRLALGC